jgi:type I restriction enzyme S subunit
MSSNEWRAVRLEELCTKITSGGTPNTQKKEYYGGNIPWLKTQEVTFNRIYKTETFITEEGLSNSSAKWIPENAVIVAMYGATAGRIAVNKIPLTTNQACCNLIVNSELANNNFIYYHLLSRFEEIAGMAIGGAQPNLNSGMIKDLKISIPSIEVQHNIAHILSSIDDKIENNIATNQTLEEIARTLFKEWFVNFNYSNADGNLKHSEFGEIPESWSINGIGEICYVQNGYAFKSKDFQEQGEVGIIKIKNINGNVVDIKNTDFVDASVVSSLDNKFKIESGALLIAMTGAEVGKIGLVPLTEQNLWLNQRVGMFQEKITYGNLFMYLLLSTDTYQTAIQNSALGSAQPNISASAIECIRAIIPPAELIEAFGKTVKPMFEKILDNLAENETLKTTRDSLLSKLMSGEIEVNG